MQDPTHHHHHSQFPTSRIVAWIMTLVTAGVMGLTGTFISRGMDQLDELTRRVTAVENSNAAQSATREELLRRLERIDLKLDEISREQKFSR